MNWKELWEKEKWYWLWAVVIGTVLTVIILYASGYEERMQRGIAAKVVGSPYTAKPETSSRHC